MKKVFSNFIEFKKINSLFVLFSVVTLITLSSCKKDKLEPDQIFRGTEVNMANGKAISFFRMSGTGTPMEIGFEMTAEALVGLTLDPNDFANRTFVLTLNQKAIDLTPFEHLVINWGPQGHPPAGVFNVPHFDFHLYTITQAERMVIPAYSPATAAKMDLHPPAGFMPSSYNPDLGGIPAMGKHWSNPATVTNPFTHTMIYGSYDGQVNFIEPMITLAVMQAGNTITTSYAQPEKFAKAGKWYPTKYNSYQDQQTKKYYVTLSDFVKR